MSRSLNKVLLIGNVADEPVIRNLSANLKVTNLTIATNERRLANDGSGQFVEQTEWHRIVVWNALADIVEKYVHKGSKLYIEGKLRTRSYPDRDNPNGPKRYSTEIVADQVILLDNRSGGGNSNYGNNNYNGGGRNYDNGGSYQRRNNNNNWNNQGNNSSWQNQNNNGGYQQQQSGFSGNNGFSNNRTNYQEPAPDYDDGAYGAPPQNSFGGYGASQNGGFQQQNQGGGFQAQPPASAPANNPFQPQNPDESNAPSTEGGFNQFVAKPNLSTVSSPDAASAEDKAVDKAKEPSVNIDDELPF